MMKTRTIFLLILFISLIFVFAGFPFFKKPAEADYLERIGVIEATEVHLSAKISERIEALPVQEGERVEADQVAVRLDRREVEAEVVQAEANVQRGKAGLLNAKAKITKAKASLKEALRNLKRISALQEEGLVSTSDLDKAQTRFELEEAELKAVEAELRSAEAEVKQREANLQLAQIRLKETVIQTPMAGLVTLKAFEVGEMVSPGVTIVTLIDPQSVWARVDLEEGDAAKVEVGNRAEIQIDSLPSERFEAKVTEVGAAGTFATRRDVTRGRQDIKTFRTKVQALSTKGLLKPGMTARVRIFLGDPGRPSDTGAAKAPVGRGF